MLFRSRIRPTESPPVQAVGVFEDRPRAGTLVGRAGVRLRAAVEADGHERVGGETGVWDCCQQVIAAVVSGGVTVGGVDAFIAPTRVVDERRHDRRLTLLDNADPVRGLPREVWASGGMGARHKRKPRGPHRYSCRMAAPVETPRDVFVPKGRYARIPGRAFILHACMEGLAEARCPITSEDRHDVSQVA